MKNDKKKIKKSLGQHYLVNKNVVKKIAALANKNNPHHIIEIAAGTGLLTEELAKTTAKIYAIEIEKESLEELQKNKNLTESLEKKKLTTHQANALEINYQKLIKTIISVTLAEKKSSTPIRLNICGNLPYNIASKLIIKILEDVHNLLAEGKEKYLEEWQKNPENISIVFLIQKEVASRMIALGKEKEKRGISSYLLAWHGTAKWQFNVAAGSFFPPPKVTSSVISIVLKKQFLRKQKMYPMYKNCVKIGFQKRRKMIGNVLKQSLPEHLGDLETFFQTNQHLEKKRAEEWSVEDYFQLASHLIHSPQTP